MKKFFALIVVFILTASMLFGCGKTVEKSNGKFTVVATTFAAYDWTRNVIGNTDAIDIRYLVDSSVDLHSYQPSAADIITYKSADLAIAIGGESEKWLEDIGLDENKILSLIDIVEAKEEEVVEGMQGEEEEEDGEEGPEYDEHIWLSLKNAQVCVAEIANRLVGLDPENAETYTVNAGDYNLKLFDLDKKYEAVVFGSENRTLIFGDRFPFRYLVDDYGLKYYAAFVGCSADTEASFETIAFLANKVKELNPPAICVTSNDTAIAKSITSAAGKDTPIVVFDPLGSVTKTQVESKSYIDTMINNLDALELALEGKSR